MRPGMIKQCVSRDADKSFGIVRSIEIVPQPMGGWHIFHFRFAARQRLRQRSPRVRFGYPRETYIFVGRLRIAFNCLGYGLCSIRFLSERHSGFGNGEEPIFVRFANRLEIVRIAQFECRAEFHQTLIGFISAIVGSKPFVIGPHPIGVVPAAQLTEYESSDICHFIRCNEWSGSYAVHWGGPWCCPNDVLHMP